jgi:hypothetical protein
MHPPGRALLLAGLLLGAGTGCKKQPKDAPDLPTVRGSGVGSFQSRPLAPFTRIAIGGGLELTVKVGKNEPLELRGEDNLFAHVPSTVVDGELKLEPDAALKTTQPFRLVVGSAELVAVSAAAGAKVIVHGVKTDAFTARTGGAARLTIDGSATTLTVGARSVSHIDLQRFSAESASVTAQDLARVRLGYLERLDATQSGNAAITYTGTPVVTRHADRAQNVAPGQ